MDDPKRGLNLVSTTVANIKNDLLGLANVIENQVLPKINKMADALQGARLLGPNGQPISSANKIAESGAPIAARDTSGATTVSAGGGGGKIASSGAEGVGGFGKAGLALQSVMGFGNFISNAMPNAATAVRQDLLTSQSAFYGQGGFVGSLQQRSSAVRAMQVAMAQRGIATNAMDTTNALAAAQGLGLTGATNFNQVMAGAATASAFAPGIGVTGAVQAMGTMNAPTTVNMLRTVGINVRDMSGNIKPLPQVADDIWRFISQNGQVSLSQRDIQISLMPGNGLYGMLTSLVGNDPTTFTLLSNMLLVKARTNGKTALSNMSRTQLQDLGLTTATVNKMAEQTAAQTGLLTSTASSIAAGYGLSADLGTALNNFATAAGPLTQALGAFSGGYTGTMGLGNGTMGSILKTVAGALIGGTIGSFIGPEGTIAGAAVGANLFKAEGGPVDGSTPYIVGEKGPELFIPETNGHIVANKDLGMFREDSGPVSSYGHKGSKRSLSDTQLKNVLLAAGFKGSSLETAMAVARAESGGRPGALNPEAATGDYSMGLFQINMIGDLGKRRNADYLRKYSSIGYKGPESLYDPAINAAIAFDISKGGTKWTNAWVNTSKKLGITDAGMSKGGGSVSSTSGSGGNGATSSLSNTASVIDYQSRIQGLLSSAAGAIGLSGGGSGTTNTYNSGPLTININGVTDPKKVAAEVQKVLAENKVIANVGGK